MRLKREDWTDEDHEISQCVLIELARFDSERWIDCDVILKPLRDYFPNTTPRRIAQIVCELSEEKKLNLKMTRKRTDVFLQKVEEKENGNDSGN